MGRYPGEDKGVETTAAQRFRSKPLFRNVSVRQSPGVGRDTLCATPPGHDRPSARPAAWRMPPVRPVPPGTDTSRVQVVLGGRTPSALHTVWSGPSACPCWERDAWGLAWTWPLPAGGHTPPAQCLTMCRVSIRADKLLTPSPFSSPSREHRGPSLRPTHVSICQPQPPTNSETLSDPRSPAQPGVRTTGRVRMTTGA
jgi:hypothetical protein